MSREGRRIAQLFRRHRNVGEGRACNLSQILDDDGIDVVESDHEAPGFDACLVCIGESAGIMVPRAQDPGRRRFSLAHELGHFHIPAHRKANIQGGCLEPDLRAREGDTAQQEWEANDFATELLMPFKHFSQDVAKFDVSVAGAVKLAGPDMYNVSTVAAAWRVMQTTAEAAALVVSVDGCLRWMVKSAAFRIWLPERNQQLHPDTLAAAAFRREGFSETPREITMGAWLDQATLPSGVLLESTYGIERLNQVVSILWHVDDGSATDDD